MANIELDQFGQPGNPNDEVFGAQLRRELADYRRDRDSDSLPRARTKPGAVIDAQTSFREKPPTRLP